MNTLGKLLALFIISITTQAQNIIGPQPGYSPEVGTLVSMLNDLSDRVDYTVKDLDTEQLDFLMDDQANRIGSLIMHLAATEAFYQVYTFEHREFNKAEKKQWEDAMNLGDKARKEYQGHDVSYYLDIFKTVRQKTLDLMKEKDDEWLASIPEGYNMNNYWAWFHVMEHQSSHLGQILLIKKRLPKQ
ncbi:mycothiol transferase [Bizionia arctica]|uniref:DinB family protein n=1 Tax=Bizionia arctica TaxID=1495645 RepID=A0A917GE93_9FLAO|nr:DUF664 domain-containing protein [Bizionia arctica]GGG41875.1 hypothetical protein GCM10010976_11780 [Bizionia arctica]